MNDEEINAILQMESPEYDRDGIRIYPNAAGRISISSERLGCEDLVTLDARNIEETCEVLLAFAKWLKLNTTTLDFIENKKQKGDTK